MDTRDTEERYINPRICACMTDKLVSDIERLRKQIKEDSEIQYYIESHIELETLNETLSRFAEKCGLVNEYDTIYFYQIKKIKNELKSSPPNFEELMSLIDELQIKVWSDLCHESPVRLPTSGKELTQKELKDYALSEKEQRKYGLLEEDEKHL